VKGETEDRTSNGSSGQLQGDMGVGAAEMKGGTERRTARRSEVRQSMKQSASNCKRRYTSEGGRRGGGGEG
jgi:hypothetical protein